MAGGRGCHGAAVERRTTPQPPPGQRPAPRPVGPSGCQTGRPPPGSSLPSSRGGLATSCSPWQDRAADADRAKRSRPAAREKGSSLPGQATPAVGLGQPGILSAHHSNLLHARQPAMSAHDQQLSRRPKVPCAGTFGHGARLPRHGGLTVTRGLEADAEQRDQTCAPRNRDPREAETGPLVDSCPGPARTAAAPGRE
jgi:hypothetical protein